MGEIIIGVFVCWFLFTAGLAAMGVMDACVAISAYFRTRTEFLKAMRGRKPPL